MSVATAQRTRSRVGWGDLLWLTWRQHRWTLGLTAFGVLAVIGHMAWIHTRATDVIAMCGGGCSRADVAAASELTPLISASQSDLMVPLVLGVVIGVFWAAPLLSREFEQRTHLVAWSQDLTAVRWLVGKVVLLAAAAVVLSVAMGATSANLITHLNSVGFQIYNPYSESPFGSAPLVQAGYALFGFALGLAFSALTRRTVLSTGLTLTTFVVVREVVARWVRPHYLTPVHSFEPWSTPGKPYVPQVPPDGLRVDSGYADAAGNRMDVPAACMNQAGDYQRCVTEHGVAGHYVFYHPAERVFSFQVIEFALFTALALALFGFTWFRVRRPRRV
ncbi:MAG TPA: hypothetical protein VGP03_13055 [Pseudonocardiaceae bacterium]|jgi:hypothetical protein|nr:hypothetical protein [Pseudonocardiaceae bacterium]